MEEDFPMGSVADMGSYGMPDLSALDTATVADANSFVDDNVSKTNLPQEPFVPAPPGGATDFSAQSKAPADSTMLPPVTVTAPPPPKGVVVPSATGTAEAKPVAPAAPVAATPAVAPTGRTYSSDVEAGLAEASKKYNIPLTTLKAVVGVESSGNPNANANNPKTQYKGLFQIGREEWKTHGGGGDIYNARDNAMAGASLMAANSRLFEKMMKRPPTPAELYLMHQQGPGFFSKGTTTNLAGNLPAGARTPENMTREGFQRWWTNRFNRELAKTGGEPSASTGASLADRAYGPRAARGVRPGAGSGTSATEAESWGVVSGTGGAPAGGAGGGAGGGGGGEEQGAPEQGQRMQMGSILKTPPPTPYVGGSLPLMPGLPMMGGVASLSNYRRHM